MATAIPLVLPEEDNRLRLEEEEDDVLLEQGDPLLAEGEDLPPEEECTHTYIYIYEHIGLGDSGALLLPHQKLRAIYMGIYGNIWVYTV